MKKMCPRGSSVICPSRTVLGGKVTSPLVSEPCRTFSSLKMDSVTVDFDGPVGSFEKTRISLFMIVYQPPDLAFWHGDPHPDTSADHP
jgi:hypothetical protein